MFSFSWSYSSWVSFSLSFSSSTFISFCLRLMEALAFFSMTSSSRRLESWVSAYALSVAYSVSYFKIFSLSFFSASGSNLETYLTAALGVVGVFCASAACLETLIYAEGVFCTSAACLEEPTFAGFLSMRFLLGVLWLASCFFELVFTSDLVYLVYLDCLEAGAAFFSGLAALRSVFSIMVDSEC